MAGISKPEVAQLRRLQEDSAWDVVERMLAKRIAELNARGLGTTADNAFEELRSKHKCQGAVEELTKFFADLEQGAFDD